MLKSAITSLDLDCADRVLASLARAQGIPLTLPFPSQRRNPLPPRGRGRRWKMRQSHQLRTEAGEAARSTSQKSWLQLGVSSAAQKPKIARLFLWNGSVCHQLSHSCSSCTAQHTVFQNQTLHWIIPTPRHLATPQQAVEGRHLWTSKWPNDWWFGRLGSSGMQLVIQWYIMIHHLEFGTVIPFIAVFLWVLWVLWVQGKSYGNPASSPALSPCLCKASLFPPPALCLSLQGSGDSSLCRVATLHLNYLWDCDALSISLLISIISSQWKTVLRVWGFRFQGMGQMLYQALLFLSYASPTIRYSWRKRKENMLEKSALTVRHLKPRKPRPDWKVLSTSTSIRLVQLEASQATSGSWSNLESPTANSKLQFVLCGPTSIPRESRIGFTKMWPENVTAYLRT